MEYLSRAVVTTKSSSATAHSNEGEFLQEIEEKLDVSYTRFFIRNLFTRNLVAKSFKLQIILNYYFFFKSLASRPLARFIINNLTLASDSHQSGLLYFRRPVIQALVRLGLDLDSGVLE